MKPKNNFKRELEKKQKGLFLVGLLVALSVTLMAFEWATFDVDYLAQENTLEEESITIEVPKEIEIEKPKPKKVIPKKVVEFNPTMDTLQVMDYDTAIDLNPIVDTMINEPIVAINPDDDGGTGPQIDDNEIVTVAGVMPKFPGGEKALYKYLSKNIKYPYAEKQMGIQGRVFIQFVVEKNGQITDVHVVRGIGSACDAEAARVVKKMPKWSPGYQMGKPVRVRYTLPILYKIKP